jgi:hypothetical protein
MNGFLENQILQSHVKKVELSGLVANPETCSASDLQIPGAVAADQVSYVLVRNLLLSFLLPWF